MATDVCCQVRSKDEPSAVTVARYPHTNRERTPGIAVYVQLEPA